MLINVLIKLLKLLVLLLSVFNSPLKNKPTILDELINFYL